VAQFDRLTEQVLRGFASRTSRRSVFSLLGGMLAGAASLPLLPVAKGADGPPANPNDPNSGEPAAQLSGNPQDPAIGPSATTGAIAPSTARFAPATAAPSPAARPAPRCRRSPGSALAAIPPISATTSSRTTTVAAASRGAACACQNNNGDRPVVRPQTNNEVTWCFGTKSQSYTCTVALILGVAIDQKK